MKRSILGWILVAGLSVTLSSALILAQTKATQKAGETKAAKKETGAAEKTKAAAAEKKEAAPAAAKKQAELVDINSAGKQELMTLPGIGEELSQKIIQGRPYKMKTQLKSRKVIPDATYEKIAAKIIAKQAAKPAKKQ
jgi:DNA uptake protein ComE-like DNA-binding protein